MNTISVIVPTMWSFEPFSPYIQGVADLLNIHEVIIIDNNPAKTIRINHDKIRFIEPGRNIYVNPAWNLGAKNASSDILCFLNDDLLARHDVFAYVKNLFSADENEEIGLVGLDWDHPDGALGHRYLLARHSPAFGCLMFIRAKDYRPIPESLKIWHGDDYLLLLSLLTYKRVVAVSGYAHGRQIRSVSTWKIHQEIETILARDSVRWNRYIRRLMLLRYRPVQAVKGFLLQRFGLP